MYRVQKIMLVALAWLGSITLASGQLKFDALTQEMDASPEDEKILLKFSFANPTEEAVRVKGLESRCGCIKASSDRGVYAPGEKGTVEALFSLGSFIGTHQKVVYMTTEEPDDRRYKLTVTVNIPEVVTIEPKVSKWTEGGPMDEKVIDVRFIGDDPMHILNIISTRSQIVFRTEEVEAGRHYRISLKPETTEGALMGALKIETDSETAKYRRQLAFFTVSRERGRPVVRK